MTVLALLTVVGVTGPTGASAADSSFASSSLTFEARVQAERAIQDVYWSHRIWPAENPSPKPSLEEVVSDEALRGIVEDYLRKSSALERIRARPISHGDLQAEVDRMARGTQSPIVLRELFGALGDDPFLIA